MTGDFSRQTFDRKKHYLRVLMQQGRVLLDADWNEQAAILLHYLQTLAADLIGPHGGPAHDLGFTLAADTNRKHDFIIGSGHYYVAGRLCENEEAVYFSKQPDYESALPSGRFIVYLDVWERCMTWLEDPQAHEPALGNVDTAARAKLVWQVRLTNNTAPQVIEKIKVGNNEQDVPRPLKLEKNDLEKYWRLWIEDPTGFQPLNRGLLRAKGKSASKKEKQAEASTCLPEVRYRGAENHLYRVEVHKGGAAGTATFKWSRDNGAVAFPIAKMEGDLVFLEHLGTDNQRSLDIGDWVEVLDDDKVNRQEPGPLVEIADIDRAERTIRLKAALGQTLPVYKAGGSKHPIVRRWESGEITIAEGAIASDKWFELESGILILFDPFVDTRNSGNEVEIKHHYRTGDYWTIPARASTHNVIWPEETDNQGNKTPQAISPDGVEHYYAPLWIIEVNGDGSIVLMPTNGGDCRCSFTSLCAEAIGGMAMAAATSMSTGPVLKPEIAPMTKPRSAKKTGG